MDTNSILNDIEMRGGYDDLFSGSGNYTLDGSGGDDIGDSMSTMQMLGIGAIICAIIYLLYVYFARDQFTNLDDRILGLSQLRTLRGDCRDNTSLAESTYHCPCDTASWTKCDPMDSWVGPRAFNSRAPPMLSTMIGAGTGRVEGFTPRTEATRVLGIATDNDLTMIATGF